MNALKVIGAGIVLLLLGVWDGSFAYEKPGGAGSLRASIGAVQKYRAPQIQTSDVMIAASQRSPVAAAPVSFAFDARDAWRLSRLGPMPEFYRLMLGDNDPVWRGHWGKIETPVPLPVFDNRGELRLERLAPLPEYYRLMLGDNDVVRRGGWGKIEMPIPLPVFD